MSATSLERTVNAHSDTRQGTPLNAFELHPDNLSWELSIYRLEALTTSEQELSSSSRQGLREVLYHYARKVARIRRPGPFWLVDDHHVAAPRSFNVPDSAEFEGYRIQQLSPRTVHAAVLQDAPLVREILKAATRDSLKRSTTLGDLIQDGTRFFERPDSHNLHETIHYCRRYEIRPLQLRAQNGGTRWVLQLVVDTLSVSALTVGQHYRNGNVEDLAINIRAKRKNRRTRSGGDTAIRLLYLPEGGCGKVVTLSDPERVFTHADYTSADQQTLSDEMHTCVVFPEGPIPLPGDALSLILDTQITGQEHRETILDVPVRARLYQTLQAQLDGTEAYGVTLRLHQNLVEVESEVIAPPSLRLKNRSLAVSVPVTAKTLEDRMRARSAHVRRHGYLKSTDINPVVAVPERYGRTRGERLVHDLEAVVKEQGLEVRIAGPIVYRDVDDLRRQLGDHDALIAVLPERSNAAQHPNDTHEQIKKGLGVTSQCIYSDHTRRLSGDTPRQERSAGHNYQAVLLNLVVKHGWVPFLPEDTGHYNVHFGIDVGGVLNNKVMVCVGYGFEESLALFYAEEIKVGTAQAEPIQDGLLYMGLTSLLGRMESLLRAKKFVPNFNRMLFFRDGDSNGQGDVWQERDALAKLYNEFRERGLVNDQASWVLVEISKNAANWRQLRLENGRLLNPLIGTVSFPFDDANTALVSTTGAPLLSQGTARPLLVKMNAVAGTFDPRQVVRDLLWEADLCFTKLDHGYALPFTLHVADQGALQLSRAYDVSGITL